MNIKKAVVTYRGVDGKLNTRIVGHAPVEYVELRNLLEAIRDSPFEPAVHGSIIIRFECNGG